MKVRHLILGVLVHGLLLLWSFDVYSHMEEVEVACPLPKQYVERRLLFVFVRNPYHTGPLEGLSNHFLSGVTNLVYFGDDSLPMYFNSSTNWIKATYPLTWSSNLVKESNENFNTFKNVLYKLKEKPKVFLIVLHGDTEERTMLYIKHRVDDIRNMVDNYYNDSTTTCLIYYETKRILWSFGHHIAPIEGKEIESAANLVPLISILLRVNTPYRSTPQLPLDFLNSTRDKAYGLYCNALNTLHIAQNVRQNIGLFKYLTKPSFLSDQVSYGNFTIEHLLEEGNYMKALLLSKELLKNYISLYNSSVKVTNIFTFVFVTVTLLAWMIFLITEYLELVSSRSFIIPSRSYVVIHIIFVLLSLAMICIPFVQKWPYTYHFYFQMPVLILWLISLRFKYLSYIKIRRANFYAFFWFLITLILVEEYLLIEDEMVLPLSICIVAMLPSLPTFRKVPFIFIVGWCIVSVLLLCAIDLKKLPLVASTKYVNLSGTIWLMVGGISILWISPKKDTIFTCFLTLCLGGAMWLQNACFSNDKICHSVLYCVWPLMAVTFLPVIGKSKTLTKILHCILASAVPVMFTSTALEPLMFLLVLGYTAGWAATESYYTISVWDNLRRTVILIYLFTLIEQLTATDRLSFKCLICDINVYTDIFIYILSLIRLLIVYSTVITTYRLILGSQLYSTAILASLVLSLASLRVLLSFISNSLIYEQANSNLQQHVRINTIAIIFILAYSSAMIYARNNKHLNTPSLVSFELTAL